MGEATVRRLHAAGAKVVVADVADEKGKALEQELGVRYAHVDAGGEDDVRAALAEAGAMGPLRISVDVHGGPAAGGRLLAKDGSAMGIDGFRTTIESYLISVFNVMRLAAEAIARQEPLEHGERGVIINTASIAAYDGTIGQAAYAAAKGGIVSMTLPLARDLAPVGIRVVTIAPGTFLTPGLRQRPTRNSSTPTGAPRSRSPSAWAAPAEYAQLARHIAENVYLNGETIRLDGALRFPPK